jgi:hypothetical protein
MNTSELIKIWYTEFFMLHREPQPSFITFCQLMKQNNWNIEETMEIYTTKFAKKESDE